MYSRSKKRKKKSSIYFNTNYRTGMKLLSIIMDYCLLQFDALNFFLGVRLHGGSLSNFNFFQVNPQIFQRNRKVHLSMLEMLWKYVSRQSERWTLRFRWKIWGFTLKKLKLGRDPPCRRTPKKNFKVSNWSRNNPSWLVPVSFLYDNLYWSK